MMHWQKVNDYHPYVDFEAELVSFKDEGETSIDIRVTFNEDSYDAYITFVRRSNIHLAQEVGPEISISWDAGLRLVGLEELK